MPVGVRECARSLALPRSAVHRVMQTLASLELLEGSPDEGYTIGPLAHRIGNGFAQWKDLVRAGERYMETQLKDVTSHLGRLEGHRIYILAAREGQGPVRVGVHAGDHFYVHCSAIGKALAAFVPPRHLDEIAHVQGLPPRTAHTITTVERLRRDLAQVQRRGFSVCVEESTLGVASIGAPIMGADGKPIAAISISMPVQDIMQKSQLIRAGHRAKTAALSIAATSRPLGPRPRRTAPRRRYLSVRPPVRRIKGDASEE